MKFIGVDGLNRPSNTEVVWDALQQFFSVLIRVTIRYTRSPRSCHYLKRYTTDFYRSPRSCHYLKRYTIDFLNSMCIALYNN